MNIKKNLDQLCREDLNILHRSTFEKLPNSRDLFSDLSLRLATGADQNEAIRLLDLALIFGDPSYFDEVQEYLTAILPPQTDIPPLTLTFSKADNPSFEMISNGKFHATVNTNCGESFLKYQFSLCDFDAGGLLSKMTSIARSRFVPVERGRYGDENFGHVVVKFPEFVFRHVLGNIRPKRYLAQHDLFRQIPQLSELITFIDVDERNVWLGPGGTYTPLHFDNRNNFLCQIFGYKKVTLFAPSDSEFLYSNGNISQVDITNVNEEEFPLFASATAYECVLEPGEAIFIEKNWWHSVVSLSPSLSVNHWMFQSEEEFFKGNDHLF